MTMMTTWNGLHREELSRITEGIRKKAEYPFMQEYVDYPALPCLRLHLLYLYLKGCGLPWEKIETYCVTAGLIQMGLDSHEQIPVKKEANERDIRSRQLTVLAGDYFSSWYYYLLAHVEEIRVIQALAQGIQTVNELKVRLYQRQKSGSFVLDEYLALVKRVDSLLYTSFVELFAHRRKQADLWGRMISELSGIERLTQHARAVRYGEAAKKTVFSYGELYDKICSGLAACREMLPSFAQDEREELREILGYLERQIC
ncbi:hypothetical protein BSNK01_13420 [Bacillaceae bacterium]